MKPNAKAYLQLDCKSESGANQLVTEFGMVERFIFIV